MYIGGTMTRVGKILVVIAFVAGSVFAQEIEFERMLEVTTPRMSGDDVKQIQQRLMDLGYDEVGDIDGWYGPMSADAAERFQNDRGLPADGRVDLATWELIDGIWLLFSAAQQIYEKEKSLHQSLDARRFVRQWFPGRNDLTEWIPAHQANNESMTLDRISLFSGSDKVLAAIFDEMSPSGDWSRNTEYYFYKNGAVSTIITGLASFYTNTITEITYYFDEKGEIILERKVIRDLETDEEIEDEPESPYPYPDPVLELTYSDILTILKFREDVIDPVPASQYTPASQGIIYAYNSPEYSEIRETQPDGKTRIIFRSDMQDTDFGAPSWSPAGDAIAFVIFKPMAFDNPGAPWRASFEMVILSPDGTVVSSAKWEEGDDRLLLIDKPPVWSPEGEYAAFFYPLSDWENNILIIDRRGQTVLSESFVVNLAWSSVENIVAIERLSPAVPFVSLVALSGNTFKEIADIGGGFCPEWSSAVETLAYCVYDPDSGNSAIHFSDVDGSNNTLRYRQDEDLGLRMLKFSHDGRKLAFIEIGDAGNRLCVMDIDDGSLIKTEFSGNFFDWSPDDARIVVSDTNRILVIDVDKENEAVLVKSDGISVSSW
jgi:Tol biopolymer transport system component/peptidoglycan hydrolase-like protein with peptidoglycan-binding domain